MYITYIILVGPFCQISPNIYVYIYIYMCVGLPRFYYACVYIDWKSVYNHTGNVLRLPWLKARMTASDLTCCGMNPLYSKQLPAI